ncbi:MAG: cephalosporin hydroxylase family protein [Bacteroidales bacterium]|nr:cephalosporin hydroxylase family protein [Bacteroidales bacterium]
MLKINRLPKVKFNLQSIYEAHYKVTYRGISILHNPFDYLLYQMLIFDVKPDLIIEIGSYNGGSALYFSDLLDLIGKGEVHTIDIKDNIAPLVKQKKNIKFFFNGYENYDLSLTKEFNKILVIDDGSHKYEDVKNVLMKFAPIVSISSYIVIEDGIISHLKLSKHYNEGPLKAIDEFLKENKGFIIDAKYCNFFGQNATFNVNGYLKRIS